ncbi:MAG: hypothetical protein FWC73_12965 [Defluviitaleaceae bacterium]|nr:hypothetical protein [Defluviitaleaceae bacterium]
MTSKTIRFTNPLRIVGIVFLCIGIFKAIVGIVVYLGVGTIDTPEARLGSIIALAVVGGLGVIFFVLGLIFTAICRKAARKLADLKDYGDRYEAEEVVLVSSNSVVINHNPAVYAECVYTNQSGQRCRVKSRLFMWNRWGDKQDALGAMIYVDRQDPSHYAVEMFHREGASGQVDLDFT